MKKFQESNVRKVNKTIIAEKVSKSATQKRKLDLSAEAIEEHAKQTHRRR